MVLLVAVPSTWLIWPAFSPAMMLPVKISAKSPAEMFRKTFFRVLFVEGFNEADPLSSQCRLTNMVCNAARPCGAGVHFSTAAAIGTRMLAEGCHSDASTLPVVALCDSFGRIVYFSQGYNTSLGEDLKRVIDEL